jgi:hypothetical protein
MCGYCELSQVSCFEARGVDHASWSTASTALSRPGSLDRKMKAIHLLLIEFVDDRMNDRPSNVCNQFPGSIATYLSRPK